MIYTTISNTNDKVKFTVLNYHHEKLGGKERSKDWQFANLSLRQDTKIHLLYFKKKYCTNRSYYIVINPLGKRRKLKNK